MGSAVDRQSQAKQGRMTESVKDGAKRDRRLQFAAGQERTATDSKAMPLSTHLSENLPWPTD